MKKIILFIFLSLFCITVKAQSITVAADTSGEVVIALGKMVGDIPKILVFDKSGIVDSSSRKQITTLIAYYNTDVGNINIDSICYDIMFFLGGDLIYDTVCGFTIPENLKNIFSFPAKTYELNFVIKITSVVLADGEKIINPNVRNEKINVIRTYPFERSVYSDNYCKYFNPYSYPDGTVVTCDIAKKNSLEYELKNEKKYNMKMHRVIGANVEELFPGVKFHIK